MQLKTKASTRIFFLFIVFIMIFDSYKSIRYLYNKKISKNTYYKNYIKACDWLKKNLSENDIVLTEWTEGHQVVTLSEKKVIATSKVYPSEYLEVAKRYIDLGNFYYAKNEENALKILDKYQATFIFYRKNKFDKKSACKETSCEKKGTFYKTLAKGKSLKKLKVVFKNADIILYKYVK